MKRVDLSSMPEGQNATTDQKFAWVRDQLHRIALASRRDDQVNDLLTRMAELDGSKTYDPPNLASGAIDTIQTITVTGAALGNPVTASFSLNLQGLVLSAWVSAANTVSFQFYNPTAGALNLASGTVTVRVWTFAP